MAGKVLDLPALLRADLLALHAAARAGPLFRAQLVDLRGYRKIFEVGKMRAVPCAASPAASSSAGSACGGTSSGLTGLRSSSSPKFSSTCARSPGGLQPVGARPVVPLLVALQLQLQTQLLHVEIVGALVLLSAR